MKGSDVSTAQTSQSYKPRGLEELRRTSERVEDVASLPYTPYGGQLTAGLTPEQLQAIQQVQGIWGTTQPFMDQAAEYFNTAAQPLTPEDIERYYNPMADKVMANMQEVFGQQQRDVRGRMQQQAGGVGAGSVATGLGELGRQQGLAAGQTMADLYDRATTRAQNQQGIMQGSAYGLGNLGGQYMQSGLAGSGALFGMGTHAQQTEQANLSALYSQFLAAQGFPYQQTSWLTSQLLPTVGLMGGKSQGTQTMDPADPSPFSQILGGGLALAGAFLKDGGKVKGYAQGGSPYGGGMSYVPDMGTPQVKAPTMEPLSFLPATEPTGLGADPMADFKMGEQYGNAGEKLGEKLFGGTELGPGTGDATDPASWSVATNSSPFAALSQFLPFFANGGPVRRDLGGMLNAPTGVPTEDPAAAPAVPGQSKPETLQDFMLRGLQFRGPGFGFNNPFQPGVPSQFMGTQMRDWYKQLGGLATEQKAALWQPQFGGLGGEPVTGLEHESRGGAVDGEPLSILKRIARGRGGEVEGYASGGSPFASFLGGLFGGGPTMDEFLRLVTPKALTEALPPSPTFPLSADKGPGASFIKGSGSPVDFPMELAAGPGMDYAKGNLSPKPLNFPLSQDSGPGAEYAKGPSSPYTRGFAPVEMSVSDTPFAPPIEPKTYSETEGGYPPYSETGPGKWIGVQNPEGAQVASLPSRHELGLKPKKEEVGPHEVPPGAVPPPVSPMSPMPPTPMPKKEEVVIPEVAAAADHPNEVPSVAPPNAIASTDPEIIPPGQMPLPPEGAPQFPTEGGSWADRVSRYYKMPRNQDRWNKLARNPLFLMGLGMLGQRSPYFGANVGAGALQGLSALREFQTMDANRQAKALQDMLEAGRLDVQGGQLDMMRTDRMIRRYESLAEHYDTIGDRDRAQKYQAMADELASTGAVGPYTDDAVVPSTNQPNEPIKPVAPHDAQPVVPQTHYGTVEVPEGVDYGYLPKDQRALTKAATHDVMKESRKAYDAANNQTFLTARMADHFMKLPRSHSFLAQGPTAGVRNEIMKWRNTFARIVGMEEIAPEQVAAIEDLTKDTVKLGYELARTLGTREAKQVIDQAVLSVPGIENTPYGSLLILASIQGAADYTRDLHLYLTKWVSKYGNAEGAKESFNSVRGPQYYFRRSQEIAGAQNALAAGEMTKEQVVEALQKMGIDPKDAGLH